MERNLYLVQIKSIDVCEMQESLTIGDCTVKDKLALPACKAQISFSVFSGKSSFPTFLFLDQCIFYLFALQRHAMDFLKMVEAQAKQWEERKLQLLNAGSATKGVSEVGSWDGARGQKSRNK